jgi:hypothetical protein
MRDLKNSLSAVQSIAPQVVTALVHGTGVDLSDADGAMVIVETGAIVSAGLVNILVEDSDDNSAFATVDAKYVIGTPKQGVEASHAYAYGYIGDRQYLRVTASYVSGTSVAMSAVIVKMPLVRPAA